MKEPIAQLKLRIPLDAMGWLRERARQNRRSMNAEIAMCLDEIRRKSAPGDAQEYRDPAFEGGGDQTAGFASQA